MKIIGNPNDWEIVVEPKRAGDYGFASISSIRYSHDEAEDLQSEMRADIERHIDRVRYTSVKYNSYYCDDCGAYGDNKAEAEEACTCEKSTLNK
jgi:hypothetical protein